MRVTWGLVLVALAACTDGSSKDDADGDGVPAPLDCDDADPAVNPAAAEACDEVDNNCNGEIDENTLAELYTDGDGDGFGAGATVTVCSGSAGYVRDDGDCDDTDADIHPDAPETCDELDRNCDGNPTLGATDFPTFYFDSDQDGFGVDTNTISTSCTRPAAYAAVGGDCDDLEETINPDGTEVCNDEDDDCNGTVDDNPTDATTRYTDADGDSYGDPATGAVQCASVGIVDNDLDCDDTDRQVRPGVDDDCDGIDNDCDPTTDEDVLDGDTFYVDGDGDGLGDAANIVLACTQPANASALAGDCDDNDAGVTAGDFHYDDNDLDGFGDPATGVRACTQPGGLIAVGNDCNDGSNVSYPGAVELCDTLDNDCDGLADDNAPSAPTWYTDLDSDLFGDPASAIVSCTQPAGTSAAGTDCNDANEDMFPGNVESCDGGIDNDCDPGTDEAITAVNYRDADGDGYGTDQDTVFGCSPPLGYVAVSGDCDDTDDTVNPVSTPNCTRSHCGTIALSETWSPPLKHVVTCDTTVQGAARPTLTVTAGTVVEFSPNVALKVADASEGRLVVLGDPLVPVRFTSNQAVKNPGQWDGIWIGSRDTGSILTSMIVDSAGASAPIGSQPSGVNLIGADPLIDDLRAVDNLGAGLAASSGAEPLVVRSTFTGNTGNGVHIGVGAGLSRLDENGTQGPSFQDNVITDNGARPITVPGSHADEIELSNVLSPNATEEIELLSGVLRFTGTWYDHALPYVVAQNALIEVEDGPAAQLFIADDVGVFFNSGAELTIGVDAGGTLTTGANTVMSGTAAVIANSLNWKGVTFGPNDLGSVVSDLSISYGGANAKGNLYVNNSDPTFLRVDSSASDAAGIYVAGVNAAPLIQDSMVHDNDTDGVFVEATSAIARSAFGPTFTGNQLFGNGLSSVVFPPNYIGELDPSTTFANNGDRVGIHGGTVLDDAIWRKLDEDYEVRGDVFIGGPRDPVVDVADENVVFFDRDTSLRAGTVDDGVLRVNGSSTFGVTFTSSDLSAPGKGDWEGVMLGGLVTPGLPEHLLANLTIEYAGGSDVGKGGAIEVVSRTGIICGPAAVVNLQDVNIVESTKAAYYQFVDGTARFDGFVIDQSPDQAFFFDPGPPVCEYHTESSVDSSARSIEKPTVIPWGFWPLGDEDDLAHPSHVGLTSPTFTQTTITSDVHLVDIGVPLLFESEIQLGSGAAPVLTIDPNVELQFGPGAGIVCGQTQLGAIVANAATFTSSQPVPAAGDWEGLTFHNSCAVIIEDSVFEYGGGNGFATLYRPTSCCGQNPSFNVFTVGNYILNSTVTDSSSCGMFGVENYLAVIDPFYATNGTLPAFSMSFARNGGLGNVCF